MGVKLFGQYLVELGILTGEQLLHANSVRDGRNLSLGEVAVESGLLDEDAVYAINRKQSHVDLPFGALAVELGLLSSDDVDRLAEKQAKHNISLERVLIELDYAEEERLQSLADEFRANQATHANDDLALPHALESSRTAACMLDVFQKLCRRVAQMEVLFGHATQASETPGYEQWACIEITGTEGLLIGVGGDWDLSSQLAAGAAGFEIADFPEELVVDGLGEFLNVVAGSALVQLEAQGLRLNFGPPSYLAPTFSGESRGPGGSAYLFEMACGVGSGVLLLASDGDGDAPRNTPGGSLDLN